MVRLILPTLRMLFFMNSLTGSTMKIMRPTERRLWRRAKSNRLGGKGCDLSVSHCARLMKVEYRRCSIPTEPLIRSSFSPYRSRRSSSDRVLCALTTRSCTPNYKSIFDRTRSNILLSQGIGTEAAPCLRFQRYDYCGCGTIRRYGFGAFQP